MSKVLQPAEETKQALRICAANVAHDLHTPLAILDGNTSVLHLYLPSLINAYKLANSHGLIQNQEDKIWPFQLEGLSALPETFQCMISDIKHIIEHKLKNP